MTSASVTPGTNSAREAATELLGRFCELLTQDSQRALNSMLDVKGGTAAALITIGSRPGRSIGELAAILKLSPSGTTRLIDRLQARGLVERKASLQSARQVLLELTGNGRDKRALALAERERLVRQATRTLTDEETATLERILGVMFQGIVGQKDSDRLHVCRMCDQEACTSPSCPLANIPIA